jgi:hypothetical protein
MIQFHVGNCSDWYPGKVVKRHMESATEFERQWRNRHIAAPEWADAIIFSVSIFRGLIGMIGVKQGLPHINANSFSSFIPLKETNINVFERFQRVISSFN